MQEEEREKKRMLIEDRKRAKALWVRLHMVIKHTKKEAERDFEKKHPLPEGLSKEEWKQFGT